MNRLRERAIRTSVALCAAAAMMASCSSDDPTRGDDIDPAGGSADGGDAGSSVVDGSTLDARILPPRDASRSDAAFVDGGATAEVCDGVDNDGDNLIDNVDLGRDGICDCLFLATLGVKGAHGRGNIFGSWLSARSDQGAADLKDQVLTPELLNKYQVIIAQDLSTMRTYSTAEIDAVENWVRAGGGLMTLIGYAGPAERTNANNILARFGISYQEQLALYGGGKTIPINTWISPHPLTDGITRIGIDNGYPLTGDAIDLAKEAGFTVLKAKEVGMGHVVSWSDEWITYDSEWSEHPDYQVERFWLNIVKWLTTSRECQVPLPTLL